ncbi:DUF2905 domain-containing protein [Candidatus Woesearchaeota archaeon]|nr:DUF2905 domain-containing protein [Candidatus Woesearchaeota archaeon]
MTSIPQTLITAGIILLAIGLIWQLSGSHIPLGKLPGDIVIDKGNFKFYFPLTTAIIISIILTLILFIFRFFSN